MEAPALVELGPRLTPTAIRHAARLDLAWQVLALLEDWTTPHHHDAVGTPAETRRFRVRVHCPLPENPSASGEFIMIVRHYGDHPGWWIGPDAREARIPGYG